jgi:cell division septum initiation protein DivIVA
VNDEDFADLADLGGDPGSDPLMPGPSEAAGDTQAILLRLRDVVDTARQMPLSSSVMINRDEFVELLDDAVRLLPGELREARWLLKEREEFLARARKEGDEIIDAARTRAARMVERTEVVRDARRTSERVLTDAHDRASKLRLEAEDYIDQKLAAFEVVLERTAETVRRGRDRLSVHTAAATLEVDEPDEDAGAFFDQDES